MSDRISRLVDKQNELFLDIKHEIDSLRDAEEKDRKPSIGKLRVAALDLSWKKFKVNHERLNELTCDENKFHIEYFASGMYERCRSEYRRTKLEMYKIIESWTLKPFESDHYWPAENPQCTSKKYPQPVEINFPPFSGSFHDWPEFRKSFSSVIRDNADLRNVDKLYYLKKCLTGQAAWLISEIPVSSCNFDFAWSTLVKRYENERLVVQNHFNYLFASCPEIRESSADLENLLKETEGCNDALRTLCDSKRVWDLAVAHITAQKFDPTSSTNWKREIEPMSTPPTFAHLRQFINLRMDTLRAIEKPSKFPTSPDYG